MEERDLAGEVVGGRYEIERRLSQGGTALVYLARDLRLARQVVIKVPRAKYLFEESARARFSREIRGLTNLAHPSIVKVLDAGDHGDLPWLAMEYVDGGSLEERLARGPDPQSIEEVFAWLEPVASALDHIHLANVLHRDVKPGNILFDRRGHAYLVDFGLLKALAGEETNLTQTGQAAGSPGYIAPEVLNREFGPAYDQYSLAAVVFRCLVGEHPKPFRPQEGARESLAPYLSMPAAEALLRALALDPDDRFDSCAEFVAALHEGLSAPSGPAPAVTPPAAPAPVRRRHWARPAVIGGAALLAAILVAVLTLVPWGRPDAPERESGVAPEPSGSTFPRALAGEMFLDGRVVLEAIHAPGADRPELALVLRNASGKPIEDLTVSVVLYSEPRAAGEPFGVVARELRLPLLAAGSETLSIEVPDPERLAGWRVEIRAAPELPDWPWFLEDLPPGGSVDRKRPEDLPEALRPGARILGPAEFRKPGSWIQLAEGAEMVALAPEGLEQLFELAGGTVSGRIDGRTGIQFSDGEIRALEGRADFSLELAGGNGLSLGTTGAGRVQVRFRDCASILRGGQSLTLDLTGSATGRLLTGPESQGEVTVRVILGDGLELAIALPPATEVTVDDEVGRVRVEPAPTSSGSVTLHTYREDGTDRTELKPGTFALIDRGASAGFPATEVGETAAPGLSAAELRQMAIEIRAREALKAFEQRGYEQAYRLLMELQTELGPDGLEGAAAEAFDSLRDRTAIVEFHWIPVSVPGRSLREATLRLTPRSGGEPYEGTVAPRIRWVRGDYLLTIGFDGEGPALQLPLNVGEAGAALTIPERVPAGMVFVPAGDGVRPFLIDRHEATVADYLRFEPDYRPDHPGEELPAHGISFESAAMYAVAMGKSLPTPDQWRRAAFGPENQPYPWGSQPPDGRSNFGLGEPRPVGSFPAGRSPFGLGDVAGNVWEWLRNGYAVGGGFRTSYETYVRVGWDPLRDPKPGPAAYDSLSGEAQRKYRAYRVVEGATRGNQHEIGLRCVIDL